MVCRVRFWGFQHLVRVRGEKVLISAQHVSLPSNNRAITGLRHISQGTNHLSFCLSSTNNNKPYARAGMVGNKHREERETTTYEEERIKERLSMCLTDPSIFLRIAILCRWVPRFKAEGFKVQGSHSQNAVLCESDKIMCGWAVSIERLRGCDLVSCFFVVMSGSTCKSCVYLIWFFEVETSRSFQFFNPEFYNWSTFRSVLCIYICFLTMNLKLI